MNKIVNWIFPPVPEPGRWMTVMACFLQGVSLIYGLQYTFGPDAWHQTTSQEIIHAMGVPYPVWGVIWLASGLLIGFRRCRPFGMLLGFIPFAIFAFAIAEQLIFSESIGWMHVGFFRGKPPSLFVGTAAIATFYAFATRRALFGNCDSRPLSGPGDTDGE